MKIRLRTSKSPSGQAGSPAQALIELALVLPVTLLLMIGMLDLGRGMLLSIAVQQGAREAARYGMQARISSLSDTNIRQRLIDASSPAMSGCAGSNSSCTDGAGTVWTFTVTPSGTKTAGQSITVTASGRLPLLSGFLTGVIGITSLNLHGSATMIVL